MNRELELIQERLGQSDELLKKCQDLYEQLAVSEAFVNKNDNEAIGVVVQKEVSVIKDYQENATQILNQINEMCDDVSHKYNDFILKYKKAIKNDNDQPLSFCDSLEQEKERFDERIRDSSNKMQELDAFYKRIFDGDNSKKSLYVEIDEQIERFELLENEAKRVLNLSSDVGLAGGFYQKLKESRLNKIISFVVFLAVILSIVFHNYLIINGLFNNDIQDVEKNLSNKEIWGSVFKLVLNAPLVWLATVANLNLNKYTRLEQEYAHKEALAKSFERYKNQIENLKDNQSSQKLLVKLMDINIEAFKKNATDSISVKNESELDLQKFINQNLETINRLQELFEKIKYAK